MSSSKYDSQKDSKLEIWRTKKCQVWKMRSSNYRVQKMLS